MSSLPPSLGDAPDATSVASGASPFAPPTPLRAVVLDEVSKVYAQGRDAVPALDRVSLEVEAGEFLCIVGASGCGKSTLLNLVAGLDGPTSGTITVPNKTTL